MKLCECGCGQPTPISSRTSAKDGCVKGKPCRFVKGHNNRKRPAPAAPPKSAMALAPADVETADFVDGPGFAAWLERRGMGTETREFRAWRNGERQPSFYSVDRILTRAGLLAIDVPDDLWRRRVQA